ncbi:MAG TPA: MlaD family protein [Baekduia sp.]|uniref:MlaD family protein n=1 Tax=Baekduia sp. TaxID=2600305 RepID=UPI002D13DCD4|nr:MlaD family protein [Baekduia sp.]HMJ36805.1 MlaD family protein [Baekduia sp.]
MRRGSQSIAANPVLIGAATTLVVLVAVFLAYNANNGLPFVPTYPLKADVPSAANLVVGNEVRIGGTRVGVVKGIAPKRLDDGRVIAQLDMSLETTVKPLPKDSTILVRPRSALGLKYVEITKGKSTDGYAADATIPLKAATPAPVEFDEFLGTFDDKTRAAAQQQLLGLGNAFAGRGQDLHEAIQSLNPLLAQLGPAMANLADDRTQLARFVQSLGRTSAIVAPVAEQQASLFRNLDTTFDAFASVARPYLQDSISGGPPALDTATRELPKQRPFLANSEGFFHDLRPGVKALSGAAKDLSQAFVVGTPALKRSVQFNKDLKPTFASLQRFAEDPLVALGVQDLGQTARIANPLLATLTPTQTVCNYWTLLFRNAASVLSEGDTNGTGQRFMIVATPQGPNNEGGPSSGPANGPNADNFLHANPYPNTSAPGQTAECEAGNEPYAAGKQVIGNVPGNQGITTQKTQVSTDTPQP